jgi:TonB family protein
VRLDSPFVLALAGTIAIHTILLVGADALVVLNPHDDDFEAVPIEIVDVERPKVKEEPTPIRELPKAMTEAPPVVKTAAKTITRATSRPRASAEPPPTTPPPEVSPVTPGTPGGGPTVAMEDIAPGAVGSVGVRVGPRTTGHIGTGGTGEGTGSAAGAGAGPPAPVSIATIKKRALPKGDYGYLSAGKDYPAEAKQLGIEGAIRVRLLVDDVGKVKSAVLLNKLGHGLDELALTQAKKIEFEPARDTDDHPVASVVIWTFDMRLPK